MSLYLLNTKSVINGKEKLVIPIDTYKMMSRNIFKLRAEMRTNTSMMQYNNGIHFISQIIKYLFFMRRKAITEYDKSGSCSDIALDSTTYLFYKFGLFLNECFFKLISTKNLSQGKALTGYDKSGSWSVIALDSTTYLFYKVGLFLNECFLKRIQTKLLKGIIEYLQLYLINN